MTEKVLKNSFTTNSEQKSSKIEQIIVNLELDMEKPKLNHLKNYVQGLIKVQTKQYRELPIT